jgi:hypothetical protein
MIEKPIEIRTPDGAADGFLIQPEKEGRWPGVLYLTDIFGIRDASRGMASRLAAEGYAVLLPNIFYRNGKPPIFNFPFKTRRRALRETHERDSRSADARRDGPRSFRVRRFSREAAECQWKGLWRRRLLFLRANGVAGRCHAIGPDCRRCFIPRRRSLHRRTDQPAHAPFSRQGASLFRPRHRGSLDAAGSHREAQSRPCGVGRKLRERSLRSAPRLDRSRQSLIQRAPSRARLQES